MTQFSEKLIPADFVFAGDSRVKLFGIQYKVLYSGNPNFWPIAESQRAVATLYPWLYYGLSDLTDARESRAALHALRLVDPNTLAGPKCIALELSGGASPKYRRWWGFYRGLQDCYLGVKVDSPADVLNAFAPVFDYLSTVREVGDILDLFLLDLDARLALKLSTAIQ